MLAPLVNVSTLTKAITKLLKVALPTPEQTKYLKVWPGHLRLWHTQMQQWDLLANATTVGQKPKDYFSGF